MVCPACHRTSFEPFAPYPAYIVCTHCNLHLQEIPPPKVFEGPQENFGMGPGTGHLMSDHDKDVTRDLAENLYLMFRPGHVLDIGTKYPYLLSILNDRANVLGIDGIEQVLTYGKELGVPTVQADIESLDISGLKSTFDLITLIHVLEHFYDPAQTVEKILSLLSDRGTLFIRTPDPLVPGIQRDLTEHHLKIHPFLFTRKALDLLLDRFGYEIFRHDSFPGYGQSDYYIRKNLRGRTDISLCMIVKNEEKNITDCLESIKGHVDEIVIVDTGSEDATKAVVGKYTDKIYDFKWIDDFSAARNFALSKCTKPWILWCFHPETKICTDRGLVPIGEIKIGDRVLTHSGTFKKVTKVFVQEYNGKLIGLDTAMSPDHILVTPNHEFYSCLHYECRTGVKFCKPDCAKQYSKRYLKKTGKLSLQCKQGYKNYSFSYKPASSISSGDLLTFPRLREISRGITIDFDPYNSRHNANAIKFPNIDIEPDLMRLFGYYIAEGSSGLSNGAIQFAFHKKEKKYHEDVAYLVQKYFNLKSVFVAYENRTNVIVRSTILSEFLRDTFGTNSKNITIPTNFLELSKNHLRELIKGIYRGDGLKVESDSYKITTSSQDLCYKIQLIGSLFGISFRIDPYKTGRAWKIVIGGKQAKILEEILGESFAIQAQGSYNKFSFIDDKYIYYQVQDVSTVNYSGPVYNLEVEDDHTYVAGFALNHNCDADDQFQNPELIKPALSRGFDAFNFNIIYGNDVFCHARLFRNFSGVHFKGRVHEYPVLHWLPFQQSTELNVIHKTEKHTSENRILRNVRILKKEHEAEPNNARCLFYLANAYRELGVYDQALEKYDKYLALSTWKDERYLAQKYKGQIYLWQKQYDLARTELLKAIAIDDRWAESYYHIGETYFLENRLEMCIHWMNIAIALPVPNSPMFKDMAVYRDLPYRYLAACYEGKGDWTKAVEICEEALKKNPNNAWLQDRLQGFRKRTGRLVIECYRQGALGDCLMTTAALRGLKERNPGCFIRYVTHPSSMPILDGNKYIDELTSNPGNDASQRVYFAYPNSESQHDEGYPDKPLTRNLVQIFNECAGLPDNRLDLECTLSSADLKPSEMFFEDFGNYVTIHIQAGWSPYKEWYDDRWESVVKQVLDLGFQVVQLGAEGDRPLKNTRPLRGIPIKQAIGFIKNAVFHLGVDSFSNHAAFAVGTRAVILFGSTSPVGSGHPTAINIWKKLPCSPCYREYEWARDPKSPCPYRKRCMDEITVDEVIEAISNLHKTGQSQLR